MTRGRGFTERLIRDPAAGELRDGDARYLMLRADTLMGLFKNLDGDARAAALDALRRSVVEHGARSAAAYRAMGAEERDDFLAVIRQTAGELGWGAWRVAEISVDALTVEVANSPFADGHGPSDTPVCAAITGMLEAVGSLVLGGVVVATEERCAAVAEGPCRFRVRRR